MSHPIIKDSDVDIVIGVVHSDITSFMNEWKPMFSGYHVIIVKDPDLKEELKIPEGFHVTVYTKIDMDQVAGQSAARLFSGCSSRYFCHLLSQKKYIVSIDNDCMPAKDNNGVPINSVTQHIFNLSTPTTSFFFNILYDPYRTGADFFHGYPFSLRSGVAAAVKRQLVPVNPLFLRTAETTEKEKKVTEA